MIQRLEDGTILRARYRLNNIVGQGGMGNVYQAEDLRLPGRLCAIKEVRPEPDTSTGIREQEQAQFLREASLLARLDHPNLPKVSDFFTEGNNEYLVMDFVPGKDLKELVDEARAEGKLLKLPIVMAWTSQIIDALEYLHNQDPPVLHRDIKPANIKLTPDNRIKVVDFGLAKLMATDDSRTITVIQGRGTVFYTPLEQYGGGSEHTDVRSDIYALGATLYHLLSGHPPPEAKQRFLNPDSFQPLSEINRGVSRHLSDIIDWALEMHPDDRPSSVAAFKKGVFESIERPTKPVQSSGEVQIWSALKTNLLMTALVILLLAAAIILTLT